VVVSLNCEFCSVLKEKREERREKREKRKEKREKRKEKEGNEKNSEENKPCHLHTTTCAHRCTWVHTWIRKRYT